MPRDNRPEEEEEERPKLQSLAQAARTNHLKQIRGTLLTIGILTVILNLIDLISFAGHGRAGFGNQAGAPNALGVADYVIVFTFDGGAILVGLLFILFGVLVRHFPVPITIASLVVYVLMSIVCVPILIFALGVTSIFAIVFRIVFIIALARAVHTAIIYQREQRADLAAAADEEEYD
jgi:hypothetical protein